MAPRRTYPPELPASEVEKVSSTFRSFKEKFGEHDAEQVLTAGAHMRERTRTDDWFTDCLVVAIAYECFNTFHKEHAFEHDTDDYIDWIRDNVDLDSHREAEENSVMKDYHKKFKALKLN